MESHNAQISLMSGQSDADQTPFPVADLTHVRNDVIMRDYAPSEQRLSSSDIEILQNFPGIGWSVI